MKKKENHNENYIDTLLHKLSKSLSDKGIQKLNNKFSGWDPSFIKYVLNKTIASAKHEMYSLETKRNSQKLEDLQKNLEMVDRFILGVTICRGHYLTYRKDEKGVWWRIDSEKDLQDSFEIFQVFWKIF